MKLSYHVDERMRSLSNVVKFTNVVEDVAYFLPHRYKANREIQEDTDLKNRELSIAEYEKILNAARYEASKILDEARQQANLIKEEALVEKEKTIELAKKAGFEEGYNAGVEEAERQKSDMLKELGDLLNELYRKRQQIIEQNKKLIRELSFDIARKILDAEIDENKSYYFNLFQRAIQNLTVGDRVKVSVSPYEYEYVTSNADLLLSLAREAKYIDIVKLDNSPRGTCIVESSNGIVDASISTQLKIIEQALASCEMC